MKRWQVILAIILLLLSGSALALLFGPDENKHSVCYGSTSHGRLENGVPLALSGNNFKSYTVLGKLLRRTYAHDRVKKVVEKSFDKIYIINPDYKYQYGETGFPSGGKFKPHRTHQNGLSVDFMTPLIDQKGRGAHLPTHAFNKFGYDIDFNRKGQYKDLTVDFTAIGLHLMTLHQTALAEGMNIRRVFFDPRLQPALFASQHGPYLKSRLSFNHQRQWVRHDEHYHVDFALKCREES